MRSLLVAILKAWCRRNTAAKTSRRRNREERFFVASGSRCVPQQPSSLRSCWRDRTHVPVRQPCHAFDGARPRKAFAPVAGRWRSRCNLPIEVTGLGLITLQSIS